ncbi:MAG: PD-(D/E)XK nuclease family protein [Vicinamibacterales bacterium]
MSAPSAAAPRRMRRSEIEAISQCLYKAREVYERGFVDQGDESLRGIAFHECAHRYIAKLHQAGLTTDYEEARAAFIEGVGASGCPAHLVDEVHDLFFERFVPRFELDLDAFLVAEALQFDDRFEWRPDLVYAYNDRLRIRDWKTFWRGFTDEQAAEEFQARFYLRQAMKVWPGFPRYEMEFVFVRVGQTATASFAPDELEAVDDQVEAILERHREAERTGEWPATPGTHCRFCRLRCPIVDDERRLPLRIERREDAAAAFGRRLVLEQELKTLNLALSGWCQREGSLTVGGQELAYRPRFTRRYPVLPVLDVLNGAGLPDAAERLTVSASTLGPLLKHGKSVVASDLDALVVATQSWQLRHQKRGATMPDEDLPGDDPAE